MDLFARHGGDDDGAMAGMGSNSAASTSTSSMMSSGGGFHAGAGDTLWISGFTPTTGAAVFGACVLLFFVAVLMRFLEGLHRSFTLHWAERATVEHEERLVSHTSSSAISKVVPFLPTSEIGRGVLVMLQVGLMYLLMLAVMTYNAYYFVSILIGVLVGETLFGRFGRPHLPKRRPRHTNDSQHDSLHESEPLTSLHVQNNTDHVKGSEY